MILLWGYPDDEPMAMVKAELDRAGASLFFLNHDTVASADIECGYNRAGNDYAFINTGSIRVDLSCIKVVYPRTYKPQVYWQPEDKALLAKSGGFEAQLLAYVNASGAKIINRTEAAATNNSKPYQLSVIQDMGFKIPETIITNSPQQATGFFQTQGDVIYKSISGIRSIVKKVSPLHMEYINDVALCPTLFQTFIPGTNYRIHIIGSEVYALRIQSDSVDYRYGKAVMIPELLPGEIERKCRCITEAFGLCFSGIDLIRTPGDEWYCLEVNPSPAYSYFETLGGQPLCKALAAFMMDADKN